MTDGAVIKKITVKPGARLSLQSHEYRMEKWIVLQGIARVELDGLITDVAQNGHINIGLHVKHRLTNCQADDLVIIEIQLGSLLSEDDIIRYEDDYGRLKP